MDPDAEPSLHCGQMELQLLASRPLQTGRNSEEILGVDPDTGPTLDSGQLEPQPLASGPLQIGTSYSERRANGMDLDSRPSLDLGQS